MKFKDPKTGEVFENIQDVRDEICDQNASGCLACPLHFHRNKEKYKTCVEYCSAFPKFAAHLMGYEVIEDEPCDCGVCEFAAPSGIYGMVKCTKTDRYLPCEHKCDIKEDTIGKKDKPLSEWTLEECYKYCRDFRLKNGYPCEEKDKCVLYLSKTCNHWVHEWGTDHNLRLTKAELAICKAVGAKWVSRNIVGGNSLHLWNMKPAENNFCYFNGNAVSLATVDEKLFPSVNPGNCICVEEESGK